MKGRASKCFLEDGCSLHFNIYNRLGDAYHAPPYSSENAVGIIMAVGNEGKVLKKNRGDKKSTYLSRDGGVRFTQIAKVPLIYEFGDHGGILVAAANTEATTQIRYSWNEGTTWTKLQISDVPIYVDNIIVEPKATSLQFILYGAYEQNLNENDEDLDDPEPEKKLQGRGQDVMVALDFSGLHERRCKGYDTPDTAASDYESWTPHDDGRH